jgi:O-antigen/teichoic acid export membrane protein
MALDATERGRQRDRAIRRGGVATLLARVVMAVVTLLILAVASRALHHAEFGLVSTLGSLYIVVSYASLGLGGVLMTRLAAARARDDSAAMRRDMSYAITALGAIGLAIAGLGTASVAVLPWSTWLGATSVSAHEVNLCVGLFFVFSGISLVTIVGSSVLVAMQRLATDQIWTAIGGVVSLLLAVVAAALHLPPWAYVVAVTAGPGCTAAGRASWAVLIEYPYLRPRGLSRLDRRLLDFVKAAGYLGLINIGAALSIGIDAVVVAAVKGPSAAAVFNVASRLFLIMSTVISLVGRQVWSALTEALNRGDYAWVRSRYWQAILAVAAIITVGCAVMVAVGRPVSRLWVGAGLEPPLSLLIAIGLFTIYSTVISQASLLLMASQQLRVLALVVLVQTPLNVGLSIVFTRSFGLVGPLIGSLVATVPTMTPAIWLLTRRLLRGIAEAPSRPAARVEAVPIAATDGPAIDPLAVVPRANGRPHPRPLPGGPSERRRRRRRRRPQRGTATITVCGALALLLLAVAYRGGGASLLAVAVLLAAISAATILRFDLYRAGLVCTYGYVFTCSWTGWYIGGHQRPRAIFLLLALLFLLLAHANGRLPKVPVWYLAMIGAIFVDLGFDTLLPTSRLYLQSRYTESNAAAFGLNLSTGLSDLGTALRVLLTLVGTVLVIGICAMRYRRAPIWIAIAYTAGAAVSGWVGFTDSLHLTSLGRALTGVGLVGNRAAGFTNHQNILAGSCVYAVAIAAWLVTTRERRGKLLGAVLLLGLVLGTYSSGSRGGAICLAVAAVLCLTILPQYRRQIVFGVAIVGIAVGVLFVVRPSLGHSLLVAVRLAGNAGPSDQGRVAVLKQGMHDFEHSPVWGVGLHVIDEAHNVLVQALAAGGLVLFIAFMTMQIGSAYAAARMLRWHPLAAPLLVTVGVGFAFGNLENVLTEPLVFVPFALIAALVAQRAAQSAPVARPADAQAAAAPRLPIAAGHRTMPSGSAS